MSMSEAHMCDTKEIFHQLNITLWLRLVRIKETEKIFVTKISNRENISKTLNKYITTLDYADKTLHVLSGVGNCVSLCSFTTVIASI